MFSYGPLKNISFAYGADFNTDNTYLGSAKKSIQAGLQVDFAMPLQRQPEPERLRLQGMAARWFCRSRWPHQSDWQGRVRHDLGRRRELQPAARLPAGLAALTYKAIVGLHGPKGYGENPLVAPGERKTELFTQQTLDLDLGKIITGKANMYSVWVGYRYWKNKFGINNTNVVAVPSVGLPFATESTWLVGSTWAW